MPSAVDVKPVHRRRMMRTQHDVVNMPCAEDIGGAGGLGTRRGPRGLQD